MANPTTKEEILKFREKKRKEWIDLQVRETVNFVHRYTKYNEDENDYISVNRQYFIPRKYMNTRDEIYAELKSCFPDCTVFVTVEKINMLFCCVSKYELQIKVSWN